MRIQVIVETPDGRTAPPVEIACLERDDLQPATLGLTLAEAKQVTAQLQQTLVAAQVEQATCTLAACPACGRARRRKGQHTLVYRTVFGTLRLPSLRYYTCACTPQPRHSCSPLAERLPERIAPELRYLEVKWASLMSYGMTIALLGDILPLAQTQSTTSVRRYMRQVGQRLDDALAEEQWAFIDGCQRDWDTLPRPEGVIVAGLDGGFVHGRTPEQRKAGCFEVIVGKSMPMDRPAKCMAFVHRYDSKPKRRLFELLRSQGLQMNQALTFVTDGGETVRELPLYLSPESEHLIDWFHITMRLTVLGQYAKGVVWTACPELDDEEDGLGPAPRTTEALLTHIEKIKWLLWHGNVFRALHALDDLSMDLECEETPSAEKCWAAVEAFHGYIEANQPWIPNYGERYRCGEVISSAFVESAVNQVLSKRFVKQQQMRWTEGGAHLLLQVRTQVLNDELHTTFARWYPGMHRGTVQNGRGG